MLGRSIRIVDLPELDFEPSNQTMMIDVDGGVEGDVTVTGTPLTREANVAVAHGFSTLLLEVVPRDQAVPLLPMTFGEMLDKVEAYEARVIL